LTSQQRNFLSGLAGPALESERRTGVHAAVILAQAALESGWGTSQLFQIANNPFGIKLPQRPDAGSDAAFNAKGDAPLDSAGSCAWVEMPTTEVVNGVEQKTRARFRVFKTLDEAVAAHDSTVSGLFNGGGAIAIDLSKQMQLVVTGQAVRAPALPQGWQPLVTIGIRLHP
jgi:flagellum-specific peptidoglycan hydrolase FlgJ